MLVVQLNGTKFEAVGSKFWGVFDKETMKNLTDLKVRGVHAFPCSNPNESSDDDDHLRTELAVLMIILDYLFSGRIKEASKALAEVWPRDSQEQSRKEMITEYCSGVRAELGLGWAISEA